MNWLVACEETGKVRDALILQGHKATSCDIVPSRSKGPHIQCDIREVDFYQYDAFIAFPPCTRLCVSGARWWNQYPKEHEEAIDFFMFFTQFKMPYAIENPIGCMSTIWRKPDQIIQPWMFGHGETKATCLWTNKLPLLLPTNIVSGREARIHKMPPSKNRTRDRSETYDGVAYAMAKQWGSIKK